MFLRRVVFFLFCHCSYLFFLSQVPDGELKEILKKRDDVSSNDDVSTRTAELQRLQQRFIDLLKNGFLQLVDGKTSIYISGLRDEFNPPYVPSYFVEKNGETLKMEFVTFTTCEEWINNCIKRARAS